MPAESLHAWTQLVLSFARTPRPVVADVGAGTGMFSGALAAHTGRVVGIDPSPAMLREATRISTGDGVGYVAGDAAALPLADACVDLVLLSRVVHHLPDRRRCAREVARVLRPGGVAVVRTTVRERLDALVYDYWPQLREHDARRFPARAELIGDFGAAPLGCVGITSFAQPVYPDLRGLHHALASRPQSKFEQLDAAQFRAGLDRLHCAAEAQTHAVPVEERYDVLVFAKDA